MRNLVTNVPYTKFYPVFLQEERQAARLGYQCRLEYRSGELDPDLRSEALNHGKMLCRAQESPDMYSVLVQIFSVVEIESLRVYTAECLH